MNLKAITNHHLFKPALGAVLTVLGGLALWSLPLGDAWVAASYDYLFRFSARRVTNQVVLIQMDNSAYDHLHQARGKWDRSIHAEMLDRLTSNGCPLVAFDVHFADRHNDAAADTALADAMRRHGRIVLMADTADRTLPVGKGDEVQLPHQMFLDAATNWGICQVDATSAGIPRRHWPFPAPQERYQSLPWKAAELAGARLPERPEQQWLRYYGKDGVWKAISYDLALAVEGDYFRDKIVFIGNVPERVDDPDFPEVDKFRTPYTRWNGKAVGGVEILVTEFLNLMNGDWLRRSAVWVEALVLILTGTLLGGGLCRVRPAMACGVAVGLALVVTLAAVSWSHFSNHWFPWLVIAGGQVPLALAWGLASLAIFGTGIGQRGTAALPETERPTALMEPPAIPDYERHHLLGKGAYGEVWLVRSAIGQWQAMKLVSRKSFSDDRPYEIEFEGVQRFKPVSEKHPGLLRTEYVSRKRPEGFFYYVMELGDSRTSGWELNPSTYEVWTLVSLCRQAKGNRLSVPECVRIGIVLADALEFLHQNGLTHRDIKPSNVIFVDGRPKLADVGLVTRIRLPDDMATRIGTPGFMPPDSEPQGTVQADIYALGMMLYVISTGHAPDHFPGISASRHQGTAHRGFHHLDAVIINACQTDRSLRFASAADMGRALQEAFAAMGGDAAGETESSTRETPKDQ